LERIESNKLLANGIVDGVLAAVGAVLFFEMLCAAEPF
jgi:hypothetical protein